MATDCQRTATRPKGGRAAGAGEGQAMKTIRLLIDLTYDDEIMHGDDEGAIAWFREQVLKGELLLHSNVIGDEVGEVRVLEVVKQ